MCLEIHTAGTLLLVKAQPGARRNGPTGLQDGRLKVSVTQAPEKGKANKALIEVLAKAFGLRKSQIELVSGETSAEKKFLLRGVSPEELRPRLEAILAGEGSG